jgi:hypothetical protein
LLVPRLIEFCNESAEKAILAATGIAGRTSFKKNLQLSAIRFSLPAIQLLARLSAR